MQKIRAAFDIHTRAQNPESNGLIGDMAVRTFVYPLNFWSGCEISVYLTVTYEKNRPGKDAKATKEKVELVKDVVLRDAESDQAIYIHKPEGFS